ncbi:MAG: hypothetical protein DI629_17010, partial [Mesorhizobium amorphae]
MTMNHTLSRRRILLGGAFLAASAAVPGLALAAPSAAAQKIADHFSSVRSMTGEFVQFGPRGE